MLSEIHQQINITGYVEKTIQSLLNDAQDAHRAAQQAWATFNPQELEYAEMKLSDTINYICKAQEDLQDYLTAEQAKLLDKEKELLLKEYESFT